jgi:hypothetical protein
MIAETMVRHPLIASFVMLGSIFVSFYYGFQLADRGKPYLREFGIAESLDPAECGLNPAAPPKGIHVGDCVGPEWHVKRLKSCDVTPLDPNVKRWLIASNGAVVDLPTIPSQFVAGEMAKAPRMRKTFIQPDVPPGWVSYRARVCYACPTNAFLLRGAVNPIQLIDPVCVDDLSIEYRVEAN